MSHWRRFKPSLETSPLGSSMTPCARCVGQHHILLLPTVCQTEASIWLLQAQISTWIGHPADSGTKHTSNTCERMHAGTHTVTTCGRTASLSFSCDNFRDPLMPHFVLSLLCGMLACQESECMNDSYACSDCVDVVEYTVQVSVRVYIRMYVCVCVVHTYVCLCLCAYVICAGRESGGAAVWHWCHWWADWWLFVLF